MEYFIDTNIAIGYSIKCDKMHENVKNFINQNKEEHLIVLSDLVEKEFNYKFDEITDFIKIFLDTASDLINNQEDIFDNYYNFEKDILKKSGTCKLDIYKKVKIIEFFWKKYNGIFTNITQLQLNFIEFNHNYISTMDFNKSELESILTYYHCGTENYKNYPNLVKKLKNNGVHNPDFKIILDCHDFAIKKDSNVIFVTADNKFYNIITNLDFLEINEYKLCN